MRHIGAILAGVDANITAAVAGIVAIVVAYLGSRWDTRRQADQSRHELGLESDRQKHALELQELRLRTELRTEYMAETAIHQMLVKAEPKRSFENQDTSRRIQRRRVAQTACSRGALRYTSNDGETELWGCATETVSESGRGVYSRTVGTRYVLAKRQQ